MCISAITAVLHFVCDSCECEGGGRTLDSFLSIDIQCSDSYVSKCASFNGIQLYTIRAVGRYPWKTNRFFGLNPNYCLLPERKSDLKEVFFSSTWGRDKFLTKSKNCTVFVINSPEAERRQTQQTNLRKLPWHPNSTKYNVVFVDFDVDEQDCLSKS